MATFVTSAGKKQYESKKEFLTERMTSCFMCMADLLHGLTDLRTGGQTHCVTNGLTHSLGSLRNHDGYGDENVTTKYKFELC